MNNYVKRKIADDKAWEVLLFAAEINKEDMRKRITKLFHAMIEQEFVYCEGSTDLTPYEKKYTKKKLTEVMKKELKTLFE